MTKPRRNASSPSSPIFRASNMPSLPIRATCRTLKKCPPAWRGSRRFYQDTTALVEPALVAGRCDRNEPARQGGMMDADDIRAVLERKAAALVSRSAAVLDAIIDPAFIYVNA